MAGCCDDVNLDQALLCALMGGFPVAATAGLDASFFINDGTGCKKVSFTDTTACTLPLDTSVALLANVGGSYQALTGLCVGQILSGGSELVRMCDGADVEAGWAYTVACDGLVHYWDSDGTDLGTTLPEGWQVCHCCAGGGGGTCDPVLSSVDFTVNSLPAVGICFTEGDMGNVYCDSFGHPRIAPTMSIPQSVNPAQVTATAATGSTIAPGAPVYSPVGTVTITNPHSDKALLCTVVGGAEGRLPLANSHASAAAAAWGAIARLDLDVVISGPAPSPPVTNVCGLEHVGFGQFTGAQVTPTSANFSIEVNRAVTNAFTIPPCGTAEISYRVSLAASAVPSVTVIAPGANVRSNFIVLASPVKSN